MQRFAYKSNQDTNQSNQDTNQSFNQDTNQSINQDINQSINQKFNQDYDKRKCQDGACSPSSQNPQRTVFANETSSNSHYVRSIHTDWERHAHREPHLRLSVVPYRTVLRMHLPERATDSAGDARVFQSEAARERAEGVVFPPSEMDAKRIQ